jgi:transposase InsO family protein
MRKPLPKESWERTKAIGERVYTDVWGPAWNATINHKYYYVSFMDDYSRESVIYLMKNKSETFEKYKLYEVMMKCQRNITIKCLLSDWGGDYTSHEFKNYLEKQGTV